ncbi:NTP transferase domain-containing protein [Helicobacter saguini]|uniref:NTP transferase domain-containing protein n=1 Tax=Helicobacter saguini TaxID=1548018 RepID=A0A347VRZ4_9HELI|nr:sugar phosphate nucleotidyltransferase [Helicobacter saguini]MWV62717.1 NTP transferase domain-containing protein [Helicobacter saguini]MWV66612.1 NTP transferase domain-containing protein [Helicobacter saguini]MWV68963.1 NTP transferase domain-containing protein [Helicobacter saguini]MWV71484.1 NTP transferase domain-containing protein [Helicobacter saguini]TLD94126.1 hypothetical protein LS64_007420 [Helicobacter saguini]
MKAIILAAGRGTRLQPLTLLKPKPLLEIKGISILENMINILRKSGVKDIIVVTGYKAEMFKPLAKRLKFKQIIYKDYATKNSAASLKLVKDEITKGTIILNADLYLTKDFLSYKRANVSQIIAQEFKQSQDSFWGYITDSNFKILDIDLNATNGFGDGVAILDNESDIAILKNEIDKIDDNQYWEYSILNSLKKIDFYCFSANFYVEIDSFKDALRNNLLTPQDIAMQCSENAKIQRLGGITNINYKIRFNKENKVIRISRLGLENIIDINVEKRVLGLLQGLDITPKSEFFDTIKLSDFLQGYRILSSKDLKNQKIIFPLLIKNLKKLHSIDCRNADIPRYFLSEEIAKYEKLTNVRILTTLEHKKLMDIARNLDSKEFVLCHRDLQMPNIMFNGSDIKFIDFEYAGLSCVEWEIGNMCSELQFSKGEILEFLEMWNVESAKILTYKDVLSGMLISNYIWALWGFIYDRFDLAREYISRLDSNIKEINNETRFYK